MTTQHEPDRLLQAFLDEGPEVLPDRVLDGVRDDIHRMRQRAVFGPWRFFTMRTFLASAAAVAIVLAAGGILWGNRDSFIGTTPTATPSPTATPRPGVPVGVLIPGATYRPQGFTQPFTFTLPDGFLDGFVRGDIWRGGHTFRLRDGSSGAVTFHDDAPLFDDFCNPTGTLPDVPDDVGAWLTGSEGLTVSAPHTVGDAESGRTYWDIELGAECYVPEGEQLPGNPVVAFGVGERHRVYDVPIGNDHIVVFTWGAGYHGEGDEVLATLNPLIDTLVASIR
jgi:hypothetical protein